MNREKNEARPGYPILEHDQTRDSVIEPARIVEAIDAPQHCVLCFFQEIVDELKSQGAKIITKQRSEMGEHPLYELEMEGRRLAVIHPGVGAPLAAAMLEEVIARGCRKFVACGGAGVLDSQKAAGHILVPTAAVRDEGTSYHYLPPSREVKASPEAVEALVSVLEANGCDFTVTKTWTTDAPYRETRDRVKRRRSEGCLAVDMEAAALFAVAEFRGVPFGQLLYAGDDVSGAEWDRRIWGKRHEIRERLFRFAAEACMKL